MKTLCLLILLFGISHDSFAASLVERCEADILSGYVNNSVVISAADFEKRIEAIEETTEIPPSVTSYPRLDFEEMKKRLLDIDGLPQEQTAKNILEVYEKLGDRDKKKYFIASLVSMLYDRINR